MTTFATVREAAEKLFDKGEHIRSVTREFEGWWKKQTPKSSLPLKALAEAAFRFSWSQQKNRWNCTCGEVGPGSRRGYKRVIEDSNSPVEIMQCLDAIASIMGTNGDPENPYTRTLTEDFDYWWERMLKKNCFNKPSARMKNLASKAYAFARRHSNKAEYTDLIHTVVAPALDRKQDNVPFRRVA